MKLPQKFWFRTYIFLLYKFLACNSFLGRFVWFISNISIFIHCICLSLPSAYVVKLICISVFTRISIHTIPLRSTRLYGPVRACVRASRIRLGPDSENIPIPSRSVASFVRIGGRLDLGRVHDRDPLRVPVCISDGISRGITVSRSRKRWPRNPHR